MSNNAQNVISETIDKVVENTPQPIKDFVKKIDVNTLLIDSLHAILIIILIFTLNKKYEYILLIILLASYGYILYDKVYKDNKNTYILLIYMIAPILLYICETIINTIENKKYKQEENKVETQHKVPTWRIPLYGIYIIMIFKLNSFFI